AGPQISLVTVLSLLAALSLLILAYTASYSLLPRAATRKTRILFVWHAFDALTHFLFEGSFLYNCFFVSAPATPSTAQSAFLPPGLYFLNDDSRLYGAFYGQSPFAKLWQEYARADRRWGGADLGVVSIELLTVGLGGPIAAAVCFLLSRCDLFGVGGGRFAGKARAMTWFWMVVLATGELYGGFMTFAPEWLSGSHNLDTSNWMYLWVYLFFFNMLWVWFPFWILYEAYKAMTAAFAVAGSV
ncbi:Emopamil-binding protein, partial [Lineolata rhizophorae]